MICFLFGVGLVLGYAVGHYEGLRCECPKVSRDG